MVFAVDHGLGVASDAALESALSEARLVRESLDVAVDLRPLDAVGVDPDLNAAVERFLDADLEVVALIERGNVDAAVELSQGNLEASFEDLENLTSQQPRILQAIEETETASGRVASIATVIVTC